MNNSKALFELIIINGLRANHKKNVENNFYSRKKCFEESSSCSGTIEDLLNLQEEENMIQKREEKYLQRFSNLEIPEFISVKEYSEIAGLSIWKIYREIKKGNILADKIRGRWRIYLKIDLINSVA